MTAQFSDMVIYQDLYCDIAGIKGSGLFDPEQQGVSPVGWSTACWRGYHCTYAVIDDSIYLVKLNIGLDEKNREMVMQGIGPKIFGQLPHRYIIHAHQVYIPIWPFDRLKIWPFKPVPVSFESSDFVVEGIEADVPFTGGLLLGYDFIQELYVHMGFHPAYKFRKVYELIFDAGRVIEAHDRSVAMNTYRETLANNEPPPTTTEEWVRKCFSLEYE